MMSKEKKEDLGQDRIVLMIVEDNEYMLDILVNSLKRIGFTRARGNIISGTPLRRALVRCPLVSWSASAFRRSSEPNLFPPP